MWISEQMDCVVCFEKTTKTTPSTECGHKIHHKCLLKWKYQCNHDKLPLTCPYCRQLIDNSRITRSMTNSKSIVKYLQSLFSMVQDTENTNDRIKIIIEIFTIMCVSKTLLYQRSSERLIRVTHIKINEFKKDNYIMSNPRKYHVRKLIHILDECTRILSIYT